MLCCVPYIIICCLALQFVQSHRLPCLASCYITLSNLALTRAFQTPPSQTFPLTTNPALQTDPCYYQTPLAFGFQGGCSKNTTAAAIDQIKRKLDYRVLLHTHDVLFLPSVVPQVPMPVDAICQLCQPEQTGILDLSGHGWSKGKVRQGGHAREVHVSFWSAMQVVSIPHCQCHSCLVFWKRLDYSSITVGHATPVSVVLTQFVIQAWSLSTSICA